MEHCGGGHLAWAQRKSPGTQGVSTCSVSGQAVEGTARVSGLLPANMVWLDWSRVRVRWHKVDADQPGSLVWNRWQVKLERFSAMLDGEKVLAHSLIPLLIHSILTEALHVPGCRDTAEQERRGPVLTNRHFALVRRRPSAQARLFQILPD